MLIHRFQMRFPSSEIDEEFELEEVCVSQYRTPLDASYKSLLCNKMNDTHVQACFLDICHSILVSGNPQNNNHVA